MSSADHERVTRERVDAPGQLAREPVEIAEPVLEHAGCRLQPRPPERLEVREVVERPADRQFDERGGRAEHNGFAHLHGVAGACPEFKDLDTRRTEGASVWLQLA